MGNYMVSKGRLVFHNRESKHDFVKIKTGKWWSLHVTINVRFPGVIQQVPLYFKEAVLFIYIYICVCVCDLSTNL